MASLRHFSTDGQHYRRLTWNNVRLSNSEVQIFSISTQGPKMPPVQFTSRKIWKNFKTMRNIDMALYENWHQRLIKCRKESMVSIQTAALQSPFPASSHPTRYRNYENWDKCLNSHRYKGNVKLAGNSNQILDSQCNIDNFAACNWYRAGTRSCTCKRRERITLTEIAKIILNHISVHIYILWSVIGIQPSKKCIY